MLISRFYYDFGKLKKRISERNSYTELEEASFHKFIEKLSRENKYYICVDPVEVYDRPKDRLEIISYSSNPDKDKLKDLFFAILSSKEFSPSAVKCINKRDYQLIEEILSKEKKGRILSNDLISRILNIRLIVQQH